MRHITAIGLVMPDSAMAASATGTVAVFPGRDGFKRVEYTRHS